MPVEHRKDGAVVFGYLDTESADRSRAFDTVLVRAADPYRAAFRSHRFGLLSACDISGDHRIQVRPRQSPATRRAGHVLGLVLSGSGVLEQSSRTAALAPGDFALYSGTRPFRLDLSGPYRYLVVSLDAATASLVRLIDNATSNRELPRTPSGRILAAALTELAHCASQLGPLAKQEIGEHVAHLLRTAIRDLDRGADPGTRAPLFARVLHFIDRHLAEDLSPVRIAAVHHISVRYLHRLFHDHGETVCDHVRRRRLERIRRDLADFALADLPVYSVAARWGMRDASHFGKLFRAEFALSPRRFRKHVLGTDNAAQR
ncbi:helix-turn-helix domain-containing protein [Saccharopolyspora rosea]|uniref:Helix-turn-helix domain-containing protein n=1 Tax=Saccharopolyspora rosea TaxID=524884 RepID=A0ABW3FPB0_9PSEU